MHNNILKIESDVIYIKIGKTYYYIDICDQDDVKIYDENLKRLCVFIPEYWIVEASKGKLTLPSLICSAQSYQIGYLDAIKESTTVEFDNFLKILSDTITDVKKASEFIKLCWIELYPYQHVKSSVMKLLSDRSLYTNDLSYTTNIFSRFIPRAKLQNDNDIIYKIECVIIEHNLILNEFNLCSLFKNFFSISSTKDQISTNITKLVNNRHGTTDTE